MSLFWNSEWLTPYLLKPYFKNVCLTIYTLGPLTVFLLISYIKNIVLGPDTEGKRGLFDLIYDKYTYIIFIIFTPNKGLSDKLWGLSGLKELDVRYNKKLFKVIASAFYGLLFMLIAIGSYGSITDHAKLPNIINTIFIIAIFVSLLIILASPIFYAAVIALKRISVQHKEDKRDTFENSDSFSLDLKLRKKYLVLPKIVFTLVIFTLATTIFLMSIFSEKIAGTPLGYIVAILLLISIVSIIPSVGYLLYCYGRTFTQRIFIDNDVLHYQIYSGSGKKSREYQTYKFTVIYNYRVNKRSIVIKGDGKHFRLFIPRTFRDEQVLIKYLDSHIGEKKGN